MKFKNRHIIFVLMLMFLVSCANQKLSFTRKEKLFPMAYCRWIEDEHNGLKLVQRDGNFIYELQYQPSEYLVMIQERNKQISAEDLREGISRRGHLLYFSLKMYIVGGKGIVSDKNTKIDNKDLYLLSGMQNDFKLRNGTDTLNCVMCHFETSNDLIPYDQCILAFEEQTNKNADLTFLYRTDKYKKGWVKMNIKRENINNIPQLKTYN